MSRQERTRVSKFSVALASSITIFNPVKSKFFICNMSILFINY
jgi:hypothetical protein